MGFGAVVLLCALVTVWRVVDSDPQSPSAGTERFVVGAVTIDVDDANVTLLGRTPSDDFAAALVDALIDRADIAVVVNRLTVDPAAPAPSLDTFHTGLDALRGGPG